MQAITPQERAQELIQQYGGLRPAAKATGINYETLALIAAGRSKFPHRKTLDLVSASAGNFC